MIEICFCEWEGSITDRILVINENGIMGLECPKCKHFDDLHWISRENRDIIFESVLMKNNNVTDER